MATILLQAAGAYLGSFFGAFGATIGTAAGALGGYLIDQSLINSTRHVYGQRLASPQTLTGEEGAPLSRVYGSVRQGGTLIWATRFEEASKTERQGSKGGGPKVTTYSYFANFAVAICEGEIAHVRRIWADGKELDQSDNNIRIYHGSATQLPDPLIEAKQGSGNAPAYRGTAYAVFDRFPLANFGSRIPQVQFEVIRTVGGISSNIEAITIIPGSTEFGLSPTPVSQVIQVGETINANRHVLHANTDWEASLDELQALCPNLRRVALVVAWFGGDLRAGNCEIKPGVTTANAFQNDNWQVAGLTRAGAHVVSEYNGSKAYGGTPDDASVVAAIRDLTARGLEVTLYPFVLMDIAVGNNLPSPYGGASQPAYPWRGEISCHPAPGFAGTVDTTVNAANQVNAFVGTAQPSNYTVTGNGVAYSGAVDWHYRRMILHYANLAALAGGVNAFLIGSEFKGLTRVRGTSGFPFVAALGALASDVRGVLGASVKLTYGADWSEYAAYTPSGTNDLYFNLDTLWANAAIDAIGLDNYMPLADWRDEDLQGSNPDGAASANDNAALKVAINAGEGYDWYYANSADRTARVRTPIVDGLAGKHWVYRFKDLKGWWQNPHFERINGVENLTPTAWTPQSKPIWFTELGCPAVNKAANQPNVFPDPKSTSAAIPYFSNGGRDDGAQYQFLKAHFEYWDTAANNPVSNVYTGRMLDTQSIYLWAWDARPFPAFPINQAAWGDSANWATGHWINGRLSNIQLADLIAALMMEHGLSNYDVSRVEGSVTGYLLTSPVSVREALDALLALYRVDVSEQCGIIRFVSKDRARAAYLLTDLAVGKDDLTLLEKQEVSTANTQELALQFRDGMRDYQQATVVSRAGIGRSEIDTIELAATLDASEAQNQLRLFHRQRLAAKKTASFKTGWAEAALQVGDVVTVSADGQGYRITKLTDTDKREYEADQISVTLPVTRRDVTPDARPEPMNIAGPPWHIFLDLPSSQTANGTASGVRLSTWAKPWVPMVALASPASTGFSQRVLMPEPAICGTLVSVLPVGQAWRFQTTDFIEVKLRDGGLEAQDDLFVLNGANACAVKSLNGQWEILQFGVASEVSAGRWRLSRLLRGQLGTRDAMGAGALVGAEFVLLDAGVRPCGLTSIDAEIPLNWKIGPGGREISDRYFASQTVPAAVRSKLSYAPVHLKARLTDTGDTAFVWIRCGSLDADSWESAEIPLAEGTESYVVKVFDGNETLKRQLTVSASQWGYSASQIAADFGAPPTSYSVEIAQVSANGLPGLPARITLAA